MQRKDIFQQLVNNGPSGYVSLTFITVNPEWSYHKIYVSINSPTEEKMKQLLIDIKNIGMDTKIERVSLLCRYTIF